MTPTAALSLEDGTKDSAAPTEASENDVEYTTCLRDQRRRRRQRGIEDVPEGSTTTTEASAKEDDPKEFNNDNRGVGGG